MSTLRELQKNGPSYFGAILGEDAGKKASDALKYIEELASKTQTDIRLWDIETIFNKENRLCWGDVVTDKRAINKRFFEYRERLEKGPSGFSNEIKKQLEVAFERYPKQADALRRDITGQRRRINEREQLLEESVGVLTEMNHALAKLEKGAAPNLAENLEVALKEQSFFKFVGVHGDALRFCTVADTILTEKNVAAGLDLRVNLGTFTLYININGLTPWVQKLENNLSYDGIIHPHVSRDGYICFGQANGQVIAARAIGDFKTILQMIAHILSSYSPEGGPYVGLQVFKTLADQKAAGPKAQTTVAQPERRASIEDIARAFGENAAVNDVLWRTAAQEWV